MWRLSKSVYFRKKEVDCKCGHPNVCHYTKDGRCVYQKCDCQEFHPKGRQEFTNKRARCEYGHAHNSGLEIRTCFNLHLQKLAGEIKGYEAEKVVDLFGPSGFPVGTYRVDFIVEHLDGTIEFVEAKGDHLANHQPWPLKWALLQDQYRGNPKYKFRVVRG